MSKEDNHIDNLFKEKLDGRSFDGPPADFLADLNQRLDAKPAASKGWIWMTFLNFFIIGLFIANASIDSSTSNTTKVASQIEDKEQNVDQENSFRSEREQRNNPSTKSLNDNSSSSLENEQLNNSELKSDKIEVNEDDQSTFESSQVEMTSSYSNKPGNTKAKSESDQTSDSKNKEALTANETSINKGNSKAGGHSSNMNSNQASKGGNASYDKSSERNPSNNPTDLVKGDDISKGKEKTEKVSSNKAIPPRNGSQSLSTHLSYSAIYASQFEEVDGKIKENDFPQFPSRWNDLVAEDNNNLAETTPQNKDDASKRMFELQVQGGATQWSFNTLGTNDSYVAQIDQSGTPKWTPTFGLGFNMNFNNISIGTGVDYAKFKTENLFEFTQTNTYDSTYIVGYDAVIVFDSSQNAFDTTYVPYYDSTTVTNTSSNAAQITNQYEWIQIPLHIGYRFNVSKWAIITRAGMNIGIGIRQSNGQYPNEIYDELQAFSPVKWNLNLHTSLEIRRDFGNWHAFGKFNYQRNLTPTIDNALFERKFNGIGFNFGVGYSF